MAVAIPLRAAISRDELRQRVLARLQEKHDPAKVRHKPLSLLRPELRRMVEQMIEQEAGAIGLDTRDELVDEVLLEVPGVGSLEELFRDETCGEFMVLGPSQVIRRTAEGWMPTSVQFRDNNAVRRTIKKLFETSEPIGDVPTTSDGAADAILANGFRMLAVLPPRAMDLSPTAVFRRPVPRSTPTPAPMPAPVLTPRPTRVIDASGAVSFNIKPAPQASNATGSAMSGSIRAGDPWERLRQRVTQHFIERLAANGVYDLSAVPASDLRRVVSQYVTEFNETETLHLDGASRERLAAEIIAGMQR